MVGNFFGIDSGHPPSSRYRLSDLEDYRRLRTASIYSDLRDAKSLGGWKRTRCGDYISQVAVYRAPARGVARRDAVDDQTPHHVG